MCDGVLAPGVTCDPLHHKKVSVSLALNNTSSPPTLQKSPEPVTLANEVYVEDREQHGGGAGPER